MKTVEQCSRTPFIKEKGEISLPIRAITADGQPPRERSRHAHISRIEEIRVGWIITNIREASKQKVAALDPIQQTELWNTLVLPEHSIDPSKTLLDRQLFELVFKDARKQPGFNEAKKILVESHTDLIGAISGRFGVPRIKEDLQSRASIALVESAERYDPGRLVDFAVFATVNIEGALKRELRDNHTVRWPRGIQELALATRAAHASLFQKLQRTPTLSDIAAELNKGRPTKEQVIEAEVGICLSTLVPIFSYDGWSDENPPNTTNPNTTTFMANPAKNPEEIVIDEQMIAKSLSKLSPELRRVIGSYFGEGMTQDKIAQEMGFSQMHISRLLERALILLRRDFGVEPPQSQTTRGDKKELHVQHISEILAERSACSMEEIFRLTQGTVGSRNSIKKIVREMVAAGQVIEIGRGKKIKYQLPSLGEPGEEAHVVGSERAQEANLASNDATSSGDILPPDTSLSPERRENISEGLRESWELRRQAGTTHRDQRSRRRKNPERETRLNQLPDLLSYGFTYQEIADRYGLRRATIGRDVKELKKRGILPNTDGRKVEHKPRRTNAQIRAAREAGAPRD